MARNAALNYLRRSQLETRWAEEELVRAPRSQPEEHTLELTELERVVERAIESLPTHCRQVYTMSRQQELTYKEIARVLDISVKTVETQMGRALRTLRTAVERHLGGLVLLIATAAAASRFLA